MSDLTLGLDLSSRVLVAFGPLVAFGLSPGPPEMLIILVIALLLYGGRLPEMARTWGKTLAEFRRSLTGIQNEFNDAMHSAKDQLAIDQQEYRPEYDSYSSDSDIETSDNETSDNETSEYETSEYDESLQNENPPTEALAGDSSGDDTSADSDPTAESSSEKQTATESD